MAVVIISGMKSVSKSVLEGQVRELLRQVEQTGEGLIVTDHDRPVLKVTAIRPRRTSDEVFADVRGRVAYREDILAPTTDEWPET